MAVTPSRPASAPTRRMHLSVGAPGRGPRCFHPNPPRGGPGTPLSHPET